MIDLMDLIEIMSIASSVIGTLGLYLKIRHRRQDKKESESPFGRNVANAD
jgi:hypothetical protein